MDTNNTNAADNNHASTDTEHVNVAVLDHVLDTLGELSYLVHTLRYNIDIDAESHLTKYLPELPTGITDDRQSPDRLATLYRRIEDAADDLYRVILQHSVTIERPRPDH